MMLADLLGLDAGGDDVAVIDARGEFSRSALLGRARELAETLADLPPDDRVGLVARPDRDSVAVILACILAGRSLALLADDLASSADVVALASSVRCGRIWRDGAFADVAVDPAAPSALADIATGESAEAIVLFTSGTTSLPRGVRLSEVAVVTHLTAMADRAPWVHTDRLGLVLSLSHSFGLSMTLLAVQRRAPVVMLPGGAPSRRLARAMDDQGVTVLACVPFLLRLAVTRGLDLGGDWAPKVQHLYLAGGGVSDAALDALIPHYQGETWLMYGLTETMARVAVRCRGSGAAPDSVGLPLPGTHVRIVNPDGSGVPRGGQGLIHVHSPSLMIGYVGGPPADPAAGLLTTDLGRLDEAGNLTVTGREAELMNFRGNRVSVVALESVVATVPGVLDCRVVPDSRQEDAQAELRLVLSRDADLASVRAQALQLVVPQGLVRAITVVDELPRTRSGKPIRR